MVRPARRPHPRPSKIPANPTRVVPAPRRSPWRPPLELDHAVHAVENIERAPYRGVVMEPVHVLLVFEAELLRYRETQLLRERLPGIRRILGLMRLGVKGLEPT